MQLEGIVRQQQPARLAPLRAGPLLKTGPHVHRVLPTLPHPVHGGAGRPEHDHALPARPRTLPQRRVMTSQQACFVTSQ